MPVIGSNLVLSWFRVHDGVMRRSEDEFSEMTCMGMSAILPYNDTEPGSRKSIALGRDGRDSLQDSGNGVEGIPVKTSFPRQKPKISNAASRPLSVLRR